MSILAAGPSRPAVQASRTEYPDTEEGEFEFDQPCGTDVDAETDREAWSPETSPASSDTSESSTETDFTSTSNPSTSHSTPSPSLPSSRPLKSPSPILHPYRPNLRSGASFPARPTIPKLNLPKSQPLSRALFARMAMAEIPHAGASNTSGKKAGAGKQKLIVATKPMRTTFELGLTASELARKA